ncbi:MAG: DEAD/DEAH box helicase, partial [bacterium]
MWIISARSCGVSSVLLMSLRDLGPWLLSDATFQSRLRRVVIEAAQAELPPGATREPVGGDIESQDWPHLLLAASVLAAANDDTESAAECHDSALRIAQHCLSQTPTRDQGLEDDGHLTMPTEAQRAAAANVLDQLANRPALALALSRRLLPSELEQRLPLPSRIEWLRRKLEFTIHLADDSVIAVNRFQRRLWTEVEAADWLSFSAPTSAGKSYLVTRWVVDLVRRRHPATIVYVVPTRALISQVENDLTKLIREANISDVVISSLPLARSIKQDRSNILVLTQERLHILLTVVPTLVIDALIVDEAHKVGDGHRGVLLQQVIERVTAATRDAKIVFASPMTSNPEVLVADAPLGRRRAAFTSNEITVNQN